jgi:hypothetical protein
MKAGAVESKCLTAEVKFVGWGWQTVALCGGVFVFLSFQSGCKLLSE